MQRYHDLMRPPAPPPRGPPPLSAEELPGGRADHTGLTEMGESIEPADQEMSPADERVAANSDDIELNPNVQGTTVADDIEEEGEGNEEYTSFDACR